METAGQTKKRKREEETRKRKEEKAIAKIKANKSFQRRRRFRADNAEDLSDEDEAARRFANQWVAPDPCQMANCEICETRFNVTAYSRAGPDGGLLCLKCSKELDNDEGARKPKRKRAVVPRRQAQSNLLEGILQNGSKDLLTLCIETLAKNVHMASDLGELPPKIVDSVAAILAKKRLLNPATLELFLRPASESITIYEAAYLQPDDFIRIFQVVPSVKHLRLRNAIQFKNKVMDYLIGSPVLLESFSIHGANLIDDQRWDEYLRKKGSHLKELKVYYMDGHFGDEQLELLPLTVPQLDRLKVSHNQRVSDAGIAHIAQLPNLKHLTLEIYHTTTSASYTTVINAIGSNLLTLAVRNISWVEDSLLQAIHVNCTQLRKLRLADNETFTDAGFVSLFTDWSNPPLRHIDLAKCRHIDASLASSNAGNIGLSSAGFEALMAHSGSQLRFLKIQSCRHISYEAFQKVFSDDKTYPFLKALDVSFCGSVDDYIVGCIFRACPELKTLKVFGNFGVKSVKVPRGKMLIGVPTAQGMEIEGMDEIAST